MNNIECANLAASRVGFGGQHRITNLETDDSELAECVRRVFQPALFAVLAEFSWPFARTARALSESSAEVPPGWQYAYTLPTNALSIRYVADDGFVPDWLALSAHVPRWEIMAHPTIDGQIIVTDVPDAYVWFTKKITEVAFTTEPFGQAVAWRVAAELGVGLRADARLVQKAEQNYVGAVEIAVAHAMNQRGGQLQPDAAVVLARGGGYVADPGLLRNVC